jgi:hypothetical protein
MEVISMKFRFNFNLEVWVDGIEIEAKSEEEAIEQLNLILKSSIFVLC